MGGCGCESRCGYLELRIYGLFMMSFPLLCSTAVCPDLQPLVNGVITYSASDVPRPIGTVADHVCINGYVLVGEQFRTCEDDDGVGRFNGVAPTCERRFNDCLCKLNVYFR